MDKRPEKRSHDCNETLMTYLAEQSHFDMWYVVCTLSHGDINTLKVGFYLYRWDLNSNGRIPP